MDSSLEVAIGFGVLALLYALLTLEVMHRTAVALLTAATVMILNLVLKFTTFEDLLLGVDIDTILLLMNMMIMVGVLKKTGVFTFLASKLAYALRHNPFTLLTAVAGLTAFLSAFVDNVTTVLLIAPICLEIASASGIDPRPMLLTIVFASNIGGTATLIGDPPNIIIGSAAGLSFMDFIENLAPIVALDFVVALLVCRALFASWLRAWRNQPQSRAAVNLCSSTIDRRLLTKVGIALGVTIAMFFLEDFLGYPPAVPAMLGTAILMVLLGRAIAFEELLSYIDWQTLVFFTAMFITMRGVERLGVTDFIAMELLALSQDYTILLIAILWISALASAFVDNIPFVMAMIPVVSALSRTLATDPTPMYWALSLGACLGGNGTLVGASANVVVAGIADRHGYRISFTTFLKYGMPVMLSTIACSTLYVIARYG